MAAVAHSVAAVLLAAGGGSRFATAEAGPHKLLAPLRGRPLVAVGVGRSVLGAGFDETVVVTGAVELPLPDGVDRARPTPAGPRGRRPRSRWPSTHAAARGHAAIVVGLADQPFVARRGVASAGRRHQAPIAVATYDGRRGNPVRLDASVWDLLPTEGDEGARVVMRMRPDLVTEVACPGSPADIDTLEDLRRWNSSTTSP